MKKVRLASFLGLLLATCGCATPYEQLSFWYDQRDTAQLWIDGIEKKHGIPSRDGLREKEEARLEAARKAEAERQEALRLAEEERFAKEEKERAKAEAEWLATLTPEQRFQWILFKEEMQLEREKLAASAMKVKEEAMAASEAQERAEKLESQRREKIRRLRMFQGILEGIGGRGNSGNIDQRVQDLKDERGYDRP